MSYIEFLSEHGTTLLLGTVTTVKVLVCSIILYVVISMIFGLMRLFTESGRIPRQEVEQGLPAVFNVESSVPAEIAQAYKAADPATRQKMVKTVSPLKSALMAMPIETGETLGAWSGFVKGFTPEVQSTMAAVNSGYAENIAKQYASENPANRLNALQEISRFRQRRGI